MKIYIILTMGLFSYLFGCSSDSKKANSETFVVDGKTINGVVSEGEGALTTDYRLEDLSSELSNHIIDKLKDAENLIKKYNGKLPVEKYDSKLLDKVLESWRNDNDELKENPEFVVEAIGAAFGQDIVNSLDCEWKVLTDQYGKDLTVIHKKYKVNGFPFSSVEKVFTQNRIGSLEDIKLVLKKKIIEAENLGEIDVRKE